MYKRDKEVIQAELESEKETLKRLERYYAQAARDIAEKSQLLQTQIDAIQRAGASDEVTLSLARSKVYQKQYQDALKKQIDAILEKLHSDEYTSIEQYLQDSYTNGYVGTMYSMTGQGVPIIAPIDQAAVVRAVQLESKIKEDLYTDLGVDTKALKKAIKAEVSRGIASGLTYTDMARNLNDTMKTGLSRAKGIVRTEGHRIQEASANDAREVAKSKGADVFKQWDATLDGETRTTHRMLDGKIVETDKSFKANGKSARYPGDFGDPAEDCNCRCKALTRSRWALDEEELEELKARAEYFGLDKTEDFEDYKKKFLKAEKMAAESAPNDWSDTRGRTVSQAERNRLRQYAADKGINVGNIGDFDGDSDLFTAAIDAIAETKAAYPIGKMKVTVNVSKSLPDADFASTRDGTITLNARALRDRRITEANLMAGNQFAGTSVSTIAIHEYGHVFSSIYGNKGVEIAKKAYYNVYGETVDDQTIVLFLNDNISHYAVDYDEEVWSKKKYSPRRYTEVIPELMVKDFVSSNEFTKAFLSLLMER